MQSENDYYNQISNWDFSMIKCKEESLTNWDMYSILKKRATRKSKILDLGTAAGENVLRNFPRVQEILATDFAPAMIENAKKNLDAFPRLRKRNIRFEVMDNLNMTTSENYFDIVTARNTCIDARQIHKTLKPGGLLIVRGVDMMDSWSLKKMFGGGQGFNDTRPISRIDYEAILDAGFKDVELVPLHVREYYKTRDDLLALLCKVPILRDTTDEVANSGVGQSRLDLALLEKYIQQNTYKKGILLIRRYYGITAVK